MHSIFRGWRQTFVMPQCFDPPAREREFLRHYSNRYAEVRLSSSTLGVMTWIAFLLMDLALYRLDPAFAEAANRLVLLHGSGVVFMMLYFGATCLSKRFMNDEIYASRVLLVGCILIALCILAKQSIAPFPYEYIYYVQGTIVLLIFSFSLYRLRARDVVILITVVTLLQLAVIWYRTLVDVPPEAEQTHIAYALLCSFLLMTVAVIGYGVGIQLEVAERHTFTNANELRQMNEALLQHNAEVEQLKIDSERQLRALVDAQAMLRAEAEQRNRDKSTFLASAVHDLRQPLQAISNSLHPATLAIQSEDRARTTQLITLAQTAADTMRKQLSAILNLSRLESGLIRAELSNFELTGLISEVIAQQMQVAQESHVTLQCELAPDQQVYVRSDRAFIERILLNLIGNGIKYREPSRQDPTVSIELTALPGQVRISVFDNGLGIAPEHIANGTIFEPFFQANNPHPESEKGVGLGLSIVRAMIANLAGHSIEVDSQLGRGSCFSLTMPISALPPQQELMRQVVFSETTAELKHRYVILVEDDTLVRQSTEAVFDAAGLRYESYDAYESFFAGVTELERIPDAIVSDFRLPNQRTAIDVIAYARLLFPDIGSVVFSGEIGLSEARSSLPDTILVGKPLPPNELLHAIASAIQSSPGDA